MSSIRHMAQTFALALSRFTETGCGSAEYGNSIFRKT